MSPTYSVCESCGYINGEVNTCPKCGKETEIYSRITGYYRPVKNWNAGKTEEFKQRKTYDLNKSKLHGKDYYEDTKEEISKCDNPDKLMLFGTKTCPNCKMAKELLKKAKMEYEWVDAEENKDLTINLGVKQAPTLVVVLDNNVERINNLSNIKKYIEEHK